MKELEEFLQECYPEASPDKIQEFIDLIESNDSASLPMTKEMVEYEAIYRQIQDLEKKLDRLKPIILEQNTRLNCEFQGLTVKKVIKNFFDKEGFYNWVETLVDKETLEDLTIKLIDKRKFIKLEAQGIIDYDEVPEDLYDPRPEWHIQLPRRKKPKSSIDD